MMSVTTLILASGRAPELGYAKANLRIGQQTLVEKIAHTARASGSEALIVAIGEDGDPLQYSRHDVQTIVQGNRACPVSIVTASPEQSPLQTIIDSLKWVKPSSRVLIWPVDSPFADTAMVRRLVESFQSDKYRIAHPEVGGHIGYPVLLGSKAVTSLLESTPPTSFADFLYSQKKRLQTIPARDPRVVISINLPEQAAMLGIKSPEQFHRYL